MSAGETPTASDAFYALRAAVGAVACDVRVCDVDASCACTASDALGILRRAVGHAVVLDCSGVCTTSTTVVSSTTSTTTTTLPGTWTEVFDIFGLNGCGGRSCHATGAQNTWVSGLDDYDAGYDALVNMPTGCNNGQYIRVIPGDPDNSALIDKLENDQPACGFTRMPLGMLPLDPAEIALIRSWIADGAPKN